MTDTTPTTTPNKIDSHSDENKDVDTLIQAAAFQRLLAHLDTRNDVQNIDLMNLAGFCRNCLAKWYLAAAKDQGQELSYDQARERVYGMPYEDWKAKYQKPATPEQLAAFKKS